MIKTGKDDIHEILWTLGKSEDLAHHIPAVILCHIMICTPYISVKN